MSFDFAEFLQKYDVHQETVEYIKARVADNAPSYLEAGVEKARLLSIAGAEKYGGTIDFDGEEKEIIIPSPYTQDGLPVSVYCTSACKGMPAPPIVVYFHGGGNVIGCRKTHATVCKILARDSPCIVVNVEYRLGPEHRFPANHDDAKLAVEWVAANRETVGGKAASKLGVAGDSAGGRLAAVVSHEAKHLINFSILVYPNVSCRFEHPSVMEFKDGPVLNRTIISWFMNNYISNDDKGSVRASVILNQDFSYLPPTLIIVAELDALRDGCYAYYGKLKDAGVSVDMVTIKGVPHSFWGLPAAFKDTGREAHSKAVEFIRKFSG